MVYNPLAFVFIVIFFFTVMVFFVMVQIDIIALAFSRIGIPSQYVLTALFASLIGSFVNIPIKRIPQTAMAEITTVRYFGFRHTIPVWKKFTSSIAAVADLRL
jgi:uncharacterized membrane protein